MTDQVLGDSSGAREWRQEMFDEYRMYRASVEEFRSDSAKSQAHAKAYVASLMASEFAMGLVVMNRLVQDRFGQEAADELAAAVSSYLDGGWYGSDLTDDLEKPDA